MRAERQNVFFERKRMSAVSYVYTANVEQTFSGRSSSYCRRCGGICRWLQHTAWSTPLNAYVMSCTQVNHK